MKNKKSVYILLPVVVLVWSAILYQVYEGAGDAPAYQYRRSPEADSLTGIVEKKSYQLYLNYPDPFRGALRAEKRTVQQAAVVPAQPKQEPALPEEPQPETFDWNRLRYKGMVEHKERKKPVALLEFDGKSYMLSQGSSQDNIMVKKISKDSVEVIIGQESAFIRKR
jgi:hypothetical protein